MEQNKKFDGLKDIPDDIDIQNVDEAKMFIDVLKKMNNELKGELNQTMKQLATSREEANINFKKLLSMTTHVEQSPEVDEKPNFEKIKI
jgi:hypothetical protein